MSSTRQRQKKRSYDRGLKAERWAGWLLRAKGFSILERRYKAKGGEIDLICRKGEMLAFVEVKYRQSLDDALFSITPRNQQRIVTAAQYYIADHDLSDIDIYRFDVLAFAPSKGRVPQWRHIEAAFDAY